MTLEKQHLLTQILESFDFVLFNNYILTEDNQLFLFYAAAHNACQQKQLLFNVSMENKEIIFQRIIFIRYYQTRNMSA